jgi:hypothetical protein
MHRQDLERMTREQLIAQAEKLGVTRPRVLTQPELIDEIIGRTTKNERERAKARGWLGRARDLLARVVERGLHLPEAARVLRKDDDKGWPTPPPPLPTVTLAEIYAAQGHLERALAVLDEVIAREPEHREARAMRARFAEQAQKSRMRGGRDKEPPSVIPPPPSTEEAAHAPAPAEEIIPDTTKAPSVPTPIIAEASVIEESAPAEPAPATTASAGLEVEPSAPALVDPPLPDRYEVDEIVAIAVDPRTLYFYWEVRPTTLAHARAAHPDGWLCVRVAAVTATWEGPFVDTRDIRVDALYGDRFLRDVQPGSNLRVSLGWHSADGFEPFAVGSEVTAPRAVPVETVAQEVARWEAEPVVAPFQNPHVDVLHPERSARAAGRAAARPAPVDIPLPAFERARFHGAIGRGVGPVDTGVAVWGTPPVEATPPREEEYEEEGAVEEGPGWFEGPGGSSELGRGGPTRWARPVRRRRLIPGAPGGPGIPVWPAAPGAPGGVARLGGASELGPGGASELGR